MKRTALRVVWLMAAGLLIFIVTPVRAATQGDFALALAQILGMEVSIPQEASEALSKVNVQPEDSWNLGDVIVVGVIQQVESDLNKAVALGLVSSEAARGAIVAAASAVGIEYPPELEKFEDGRSKPWFAPIAGPPGKDRRIEASQYLP